MTDVIGVVSYNVLATSYIRRHYYPHVEDRHLDPSWRHPALVAAIEALDADLLCLQEVERVVFDALKDNLNGRYQSALAMKAHSKPDGAALFARRERLELEAHAVLTYDDSEDASSTSGHVAQIATLRLHGGLLGVANTHLRWDPNDRPREHKVGVRQVEQLLAERDRIAPGCDGWLICGDLNAAPGSDVVRALEQGGLRYVHRDSGAVTCNANGRLQLIDHIFISPSLEATALMPTPIAADTPLPADEQPSDHLPLGAQLRFR